MLMCISNKQAQQAKQAAKAQAKQAGQAMNLVVMQFKLILI